MTTDTANEDKCANQDTLTRSDWWLSFVHRAEENNRAEGSNQAEGTSHYIIHSIHNTKWFVFFVFSSSKMWFNYWKAPSKIQNINIVSAASSQSVKMGKKHLFSTRQIGFKSHINCIFAKSFDAMPCCLYLKVLWHNWLVFFLLSFVFSFSLSIFTLQQLNAGRSRPDNDHRDCVVTRRSCVHLTLQLTFQLHMGATDRHRHNCCKGQKKPSSRFQLHPPLRWSRLWAISRV